MSLLSLVDKAREESEKLYLALKNGLRARWRGFTVEHKLADSDCLVFELIERTIFKTKQSGQCFAITSAWLCLCALAPPTPFINAKVRDSSFIPLLVRVCWMFWRHMGH